MARNILIVDDEIDIQSSLSFALKDEGYEVTSCSLPKEAIEIMKSSSVDVALFDVWFPEGDGIELLEFTRENHPNVVPIMMSGHGNIELAIKAIRLGAYDFLEKPLELDKVLVVLKNALETKTLKEENVRLSHQILNRGTLIGGSGAVKSLKADLHKTAVSNSNVLIMGEDGSGKELCARLIHQLSARREAPYLVLNCAAYSGDALDEELFGLASSHPKAGGKIKQGRIEQTMNGTIFLDEISSLSQELQAKLVQTLQEGSFFRLGGDQSVPATCRVVAGAREELGKLVEKGSYSQDLMMRLGVVQIRVPPLRERLEDVQELASHFVEVVANESGKKAPRVDSTLIDWMKGYDWPGNVRELKNLLERMLIMNDGVDQLGISDLPDEIQAAIGASEQGQSLSSVSDPGGALRALRAEFEKVILQQRLESLGGNVTKTAESLGLERAHLHRKLKQYGIGPQRGEDA
ncbi:sigma-54-dependent Fis family transcriptional regulator [bacterium]|nr:sigma-54-dependent Fis family transcriptional regulator [bacterium]